MTRENWSGLVFPGGMAVEGDAPSRLSCHASIDGRSWRGEGDLASLEWLYGFSPTQERGDWLAACLEDPSLPLELGIDDLDGVRFALTPEPGGGLEYRRVPPDVTVEAVREGGLRGVYAAPDDRAPVNACFVIGGSEGGLDPTRALALAGRGVAALALAYFDHDDLPVDAFDIPLELFADALRLLAARSGVQAPAFWGASRGAEAVMLTAGRWPDAVGSVIVQAPGLIVHSGLSHAPGASFEGERRAMWSCGGRPIDGPGLPPPGQAELDRRRQAMARPPGYRYAPLYDTVWRSCAARYALPAAQITAPMLILAGDDDGLWPAGQAARAHANARQKAGLPTRLEVFANAGHALPTPGVAKPFANTAVWRGGRFGVDAGFIDLGGDAPGAWAAGRAAFEAVAAFLTQPQSAGSGG
ncbi:MAG: alpha/beta hydrolase family protein [Oceanicaulis sp.]